jgi:hypothetical protein
LDAGDLALQLIVEPPALLEVIDARTFASQNHLAGAIETSDVHPAPVDHYRLPVKEDSTVDGCRDCNGNDHDGDFPAAHVPSLEPRQAQGTAIPAAQAHESAPPNFKTEIPVEGL